MRGGVFGPLVVSFFFFFFLWLSFFNPSHRIPILSLVPVRVGPKRILKKKGKIIITIPKNPSLFVPFRWSNKLRYILFDAPPVVNAISKNALISLIKNNNLELKELTSLWTTTWIALIVFN